MCAEGAVIFNPRVKSYRLPFINYVSHYQLVADPKGRAVKSTGLRPLACLDCWFESRLDMDVCLSVCCECCVLSGRGPCDGPITCPGESYRVCECDREVSIMRRPWPTESCCAMEKDILLYSLFMKYLFQYYISCTFLC